jgi:hypothetical protein
MGQRLRPAVDAGLDAQGQAIAQRVDLIDHPCGSPLQRTMCSTGPKISWLQVGDELHLKGLRAIRCGRPVCCWAGCSTRPAAVWPPRQACKMLADAVERLGGRSPGRGRWPGRPGRPPPVPVRRQRIMAMTWSAISACTHNSRSAEQRCPALRNADCTTASPPARAGRWSRPAWR